MPLAVVNPYDSGVLDEEVHARLVQDIHNVALDANIQPYWIWTKLSDVCNPQVVDWVKTFRKHKVDGTSGLCLVGKLPQPSPLDQCCAIAGALTRNFIRARVFTLGQMLEKLDKHDPPTATCLVIPNFFIEEAMGGHVAKWNQSTMADYLLQRRQAGLQTVIYATDMIRLEKEYGLTLSNFIKQHYVTVEI